MCTKHKKRKLAGPVAKKKERKRNKAYAFSQRIRIDAMSFHAILKIIILTTMSIYKRSCDFFVCLML